MKIQNRNKGNRQLGYQVSLYAALTGKVIGFRRDEILAYREAGNVISIYAVEEADGDLDVVGAVKRAIQSLYKLDHESRSLSPAALFEKIMTEYQIYRYVDSRNLEVVYYTLELLREAEKLGTISSLRDGAVYIEELLSGTNEVERCLSLKEEENVVHIANLHKVKGLEAPIVILSYAFSKTPEAKIRIEHGNTSAGYIFRIEKDGDNNGYYITTSNFTDKKKEEQASIKAEQDRLTYVGATRARNALIICDSHYWRSSNSGGGYIANSAWKTLFEEGANDFFDEIDGNFSAAVPVQCSARADELYEKAEKESVLKDRSAEINSYSIMRPSLVAHSKMEEDTMEDMLEMSDDDVPAGIGSADTAVVHRFPALIGTMTHKLMQILVNTKNTVNLDSAVSEILSEFLTEEALPYKASFMTALTRVGDTMRAAGYPQENSLTQQILREMVDADEVYCEVPFCYKMDAEIWNGVMDAIYLKDGKWHIIDYKTNYDEKKLDELYEN